MWKKFIQLFEPVVETAIELAADWVRIQVEKLFDKLDNQPKPLPNAKEIQKKA